MDENLELTALSQAGSTGKSTAQPKGKDLADSAPTVLSFSGGWPWKTQETNNGNLSTDSQNPTPANGIQRNLDEQVAGSQASRHQHLRLITNVKSGQEHPAYKLRSRAEAEAQQKEEESLQAAISIVDRGSESANAWSELMAFCLVHTSVTGTSSRIQSILKHSINMCFSVPDQELHQIVALLHYGGKLRKLRENRRLGSMHTFYADVNGSCNVVLRWQNRW